MGYTHYGNLQITDDNWSLTIIGVCVVQRSTTFQIGLKSEQTFALSNFK